MSHDHTEDRREFLRRGATVAWATPLLLTLPASRAGAQAPSCAPDGTPCGSWTGSTCTGIATACCNECNPTVLEIGAPCQCS
jgi:anaerobic selenocysteine-containing dehydrogenase